MFIPTRAVTVGTSIVPDVWGEYGAGAVSKGSGFDRARGVCDGPLGSDGGVSVRRRRAIHRGGGR